MAIKNKHRNNSTYFYPVVIFLHFFFCFGSSKIVSAQKRDPKVFALIVGISNYNDPHFDTLKYADLDAKSFYDFLKNNYAGDLDTNNVKLLTNSNATSKNINAQLNNWLDSLQAQVIDGDKLFIYWAGHGILKKDLRLICENASYGLSDLAGGIELAKLKQSTGNFSNKEGVRVYLIIDACRENNNNSINEDQNSYFNLSSWKTATEPSGPGEIYFYASSQNGRAFESLGKNTFNLYGGVFTYFLLLGLQGAADYNKDNSITYNEMRRFLSRTVDEYVHKFISKNPNIGQVPQFYADPSAQNDDITRVPPSVKEKSYNLAQHIIKSYDDDSQLYQTTKSNFENHALLSRQSREANLIETTVKTSQQKMSRNFANALPQKALARSSNNYLAQISKSAIVSDHLKNMVRIDLAKKSKDVFQISNIYVSTDNYSGAGLDNKVTSDSLNDVTFDSLYKQILETNLLEPIGNSAYDFYKKMVTQFPNEIVLEKLKIYWLSHCRINNKDLLTTI